MIESIVISYLNTNLSVSCYMEKPEAQPDKYVIVQKTGSRRDNRINHATFAIQSYAPSMYQAAELNELVKAKMDSIVSLSTVYASELNSDYNFTDTTDKKYRYQCVYELTY